jgi:hypothetical protein
MARRSLAAISSPRRAFSDPPIICGKKPSPLLAATAESVAGGCVAATDDAASAVFAPGCQRFDGAPKTMETHNATPNPKDLI